MGEQVQIGNTAVDVADDEFANGYQVGYLRYILDYHGKPLRDTDMYTFIATHCLDTFHTDRWNAGVIAGWIGAVQGYKRGGFVSLLTETPSLTQTENRQPIV